MCPLYPQPPKVCRSIDRVDEFGQAQASGEADDGLEVTGGFFAAQCDAFEALEPAEAVLDAGAGFVERPGEEGRLVFLIGFVRDHRRDAARPCRRAIGLAGIALVTDGGARRDVGSDVEQGLEMRRVGFLAAGQIEADDVAGTI